MRRPVLLLTAPLAVGALTLAACGVVSGGNGDGTFTLGFTGTLSGDFARPGIDEADAVKLAVSQANARGDLGFTLGYAESDDAAGGPAAARQLVDDDRVVAVVGPTFSGPAEVAEPLFLAAGLSSLSPSATAPALTTSGFTTFFRDVPSDDVQGEQAADFIAAVVKAEKVYSINDKSVYAVLTGALETRLRKKGVDVVSEAIAPTTDYGAIASRVAQAAPGFVYYSGYYSDLALLVTALRSAGYEGPIGSGDGSKDDRLVQLAGPDAEGLYLTCPCGDPSADPAGAAFVAAYRDMFGAAPGPYSAEAYDAANAIIDALRRLGRDRISRAGVLDGLRAVHHQGISKVVAFQAGGDPVDAPIFVYRVHAQRIVVLGRTSELVR